MDGADAGAGKRPTPDAPDTASTPAAKRQATGGGGVLLRRLDVPAAHVRMSPKDKAPLVHISDDGLSVQSSKGYRMARATHGAASGAWYCEARVEHLGATGHARLGWATCSADLNAPVGYDKHGYGYRSAAGEKIHDAKREPFGAPFVEGDVVGMYICLGDSSASAQPQEVVQLDGQQYSVERDAAAGAHVPHTSAVAFAVNGVSQGVAFTDLSGDVFFPAASMFTEPKQEEPAAVTFNFGPDFAFAPPAFGAGLPAPRPAAELAPPPCEAPAGAPPDAAAS